MTPGLRTAKGRTVLIAALAWVAVLLLAVVHPWRASLEGPEGLAEPVESDASRSESQAPLRAPVAGERVQPVGRVRFPVPSIGTDASAQGPSTPLDVDSLSELRGESARMAALRAMAAQDRTGFDALVEQLLSPGQPTPLQVPTLRVLWSLDPEQAAPMWLSAIRESPDDPRAAGVSVPAFAVRVLAERAPRSALARACLRDALWRSNPPLADERRLQAARSLAAATTAEDWPALRARLAVEPSRSLRRSAGTAFTSGLGGEGLMLEDVLGELGL